MTPRQQSAGLFGIIAAVALLVLFVLFLTSGAEPDTFTDPAKAIPFVTEKAGLLRGIALLAAVTTIFVVFFSAGLAGKLHDKAPTRATGVLYFAIIGAAGFGLSSLLFWLGAPWVADYAAKDATAASHAWVALNAVSSSLEGFGNLFFGLSALLAGWAIVGTRVMSSTLGWFGVVTGVLTALYLVAPTNQLLYLATFVLPIIWLFWAGNALRTAM